MSTEPNTAAPTESAAALAQDAASTPVVPTNISTGDLAAALTQSRSRRHRAAAPAPAAATTPPPTPEAPVLNEHGQSVQVYAIEPDPPAAAPPAPAEGNVPTEPVPPAPESDLAAALNGDAPLADPAPADPDPAEAAPAEPRSIAKMQRRIDQVTARAKAAEEKLKALEAEQAQARPAPTSPATGDAFAAHPAVARVDKEIATVSNALDVLEQYPDGGAVPLADGREQELSAEQVRAYRAQFRRDLVNLTSQRAAEVTTVQQRDTQLRTHYWQESLTKFPAMHRAGTAEYQEAMSLLTANPYLRNLPDWPMVVARYIAGGKAIAGAPTRATAKAATPTPVLTHAAAALPRGGNTGKQVQEATSQFKQSGHASSLASLFAQQRAAKRAAA
jgi:hypothetical protein